MITTKIISKIGKIFDKPKVKPSGVNLTPNIQDVPKKVESGQVMDAKAALAKNKVLSENYGEFRKKISQEIRLYTGPLAEKALEKINPINYGNIEQVKKNFLILCNNFAPMQTTKFIERQGTPTDLFSAAKKFLIDITTGELGQRYDQVIENAKFGITPELENELKAIKTIGARRIKAVTELFTPKSTKPEVIALESATKALGVEDVNFSDDLEQGTKIYSALQDVKKAGNPLPNGVTVSRIIPLDDGGLTTPSFGLSGHKTHIYITTSIEENMLKEVDENIERVLKNTNSYKMAPEEFKQKVFNEFAEKRNKHSATKNPKAKIYHEIAHSFEPVTLESEMKILDYNKWNLLKEISRYGASKRNGKEAMPEIYTKLMDGQTLTTEQMELYLELGGKIPKI